jgi:DNA processing protein
VSGRSAFEPWPAWPRGFAAGRQDRCAALVLSALAGLTPRRLLAAAVQAGTARACLELARDGRLGSEEDRRLAGLLEPEDLAAAVQACGARFVTCDEPDYPPQLRTIHDPPLGLFVRGSGLPQELAAVAVVGARRCTDLGREIARDIGSGLASLGVTVVSGAARGIDGAAHEGALGGSTGSGSCATVAVLGCGIDQAYPPGSRDLIRRILEHGALVSEYPPGVPARPFRFPARNRIVAGLSRATVVVEGAGGSGSLITGEHALEFGREVYAVPGAVNNALAQVPLALVRDGATMIRGVQDLLADLGLDGLAPARPADLTLAQHAAIEALAGPTLPERVARELGIPLTDALTMLMELEMRGLVRGVGGRFEATLAARSAGGAG